MRRESRFGEYGQPREAKILACETAPLEAGGDLKAALQSIALKIPSSGVKPHSLVVSLSPAQVMFRHVFLPFRDDAKIRKTLPFELEPLLPVPIEEVATDYVPLPEGAALAAAVSKEKIKTILAAVEEHLGPVSAIDIAPALLAAPFLEQKKLTGSGILLDVGARETSAAFYEKNALVLIRSFPFGGDTMTAALAGDLSVTGQEAEQAKIAGAYGETIDQARAACREFGIRLANTVEFLRLRQILQDAPARIFLTGGGSLFGPLQNELGQMFGVPVEDYDALTSGRPDRDDSIQSRYETAVMAVALAAARRRKASGLSFNFRRGEFEAGSVSSNLSRQWKWAAAVGALLLALAAADMILDYTLLSRQTTDLKKSVSRIFYRHFPPQTVMVDPANQLQKKLAEDRKAYGMEEGGSGIAVLNLLKDLSEGISPTREIVLTHLHYEKKLALVRGEAKKAEEVSRVQSELQKAPAVQSVTVGSTALARDGATVNFDFRIELR